MFHVFSFPPGVYVGTFNLIASIPGTFILTCYRTGTLTDNNNRLSSLFVLLSCS